MRTATIALCFLGLLAGCTAGGVAETPTSTAALAATAGAPVTGSIQVFAGASLKAAFEDVAAALMEQNPGLDIQFNFGGSNALVDQIAEGAPADVLATADTPTMETAVGKELVSDPRPFASNSLVLAVPEGNPAGVTGLDESLDGAKLVVCAPDVPCGRASLALAELVGVTLQPVSEELAVTDVRGKVESGEADAGLIYQTDAALSPDLLDVIDVPEAAEVTTVLQIAVVSTDSAAATLFHDYVLSEDGQEILAGHGFGPTPAA